MMSHTKLRLGVRSGLHRLISSRVLGMLDGFGLLRLSAVKRMAVGGLTFSLGVMLVFGVTSGLSVAQVVADPNAGGYKPQIIHPNNTNNVPIINITRPNAAGVSRNQYHQFNVGKQGLILNNGMYNSFTHLGGWIDSNPNLAHGQARIILNEVTSGNPSLLRGYIEVGGGRAEVIIANPAGISVNGGGFINASGVTLTTGIPQINQQTGHIESYRVVGGRVSIDGDGLDTQGADFTRIITRAAEVNSGVWAKDLTITAGLGTFLPSGEALELTVLDPSGRPQFAIDVAELGGMYAGKIRLIGTEEGVGVRNAGQIGASVGQVEITASGQLVNTATGRIASHGAGAGIQLKSTQDLINAGSIYTAGGLQANVSNISNSGTFAAGKDVRITAQTTHNQADGLIAGGLNSEGKLSASGGVNIQGQTLNNEGELIAGGDINLNVTQLSNQGSSIHAGNNLEVNAQTLDNTNGGKLVSGKDMLLKTTQLNNQAGVISAGQSLKLQGQNAAINNRIDNTSGVIIAGKSLDAKAQSLTNTAGEVLSQGDLNLHLTQGTTLEGQIIADDNLSVQVDGSLVNLGSLLAGEKLDLKSSSLDNQASGTISASKTQINTQSLTNRGLIDGGLTYIHATALTNIGTGRIYGNHLAIQANQLTNTAETVGGQTKAATIAARQRLDLGVQTLKNEKGALISSHGDMAIGGALDADHLATGQATLIHNEGATIEADGSLHISAQQINNTNTHFAYVDQKTSSQSDLYKVMHMGTEYDPSEVILVNKFGFPISNPAPSSAATLLANLFGPSNDNYLVINGTPVFDFFIKSYTQEEYVPVTTASSPGQILSGGNMVLDSDVLNDKSRIQAGGDLQMTGEVKTIDAKGTQHSKRHFFIWQKTKGNTVQNTGFGDTEVVNQVEVSLTASTPIKNTPLGGSGTQIGDLTTGIVQDPSGVSTTRPNLGLPEGSLHNITKDKDKGYWIETDPNLINYGNWISSNLILERLGLDPQGVQKRLGDGYYEQKLVREQIGQLTGYRFLAGYDSDDEQYKALLNAGVEFALEHNLSVGIALTSEQMQHLTSDIVWLVSAEVRLPNGQVEQVLVPQVYVRSGANMIKSDGALISANNVYIGKNTSTGTSEEIKNKPSLINHATIAARQGLFVDAQELKNLTGQLHGEDVVLRSATDIDNLGGVISAQNSITMVAERDVNIKANVVDSATPLGKRTEVSNIGTVYLAGQDQEAIPSAAKQEGAPSAAPGQIHIQAGRDVNLKGGMIINDAPSNLPSLPALETPDGQEAAPASTLAKTGQGKTSIVASGNINIGTVSTEHEEFIGVDAKNWSYSKGSQEHGSQIFTEGDIELAAGGDLTVRGSSIESSSGSLIGQAQNITVEASQDEFLGAQSAYSKKSSGLSSKSRHSVEMGSGTSLNASSLSAESIHLQAQTDVNIKASQVIGTGDVNLVAQTGNVNLLSDAEKHVSLSFEKTKQSGITSGNKAVSIGSSKTSTFDMEDKTSAIGAMVGSIAGDVNILAATGNYSQVGSDVLAVTGDINVQAQDITIKEAREQQSLLSTREHKQKGLTLGVYSPLADRVSSYKKQAKDLTSSNSGSRWAGLSGMLSPNHDVAFNDAIDKDEMPQLYSSGTALWGANMGFNSKKEQSVEIEKSNTSKASSLNAGGNIKLVATGKDAAGSTPEVPLKEGGNITVQGSHLGAGENITLAANEKIKIQASSNQMTGLSAEKKKSSAIGLAVEMGGIEGATVGVTGGKSRSNNNSISKEQIWSYSTLTAGENLNLISGGDTDILGAHLDAETINASVGGDLNIASPQNSTQHLGFGESSTTKFAIGPQVMAGGKKDKNAQIARQESINSTTLNADNINLSAQKDINITAANVVATDDLNLVSHTGNIAILAGKTTDTDLQTTSNTRLGPLPSEGGISATVGKETIKQNSMESNEFAVGSTVGSLGGNVNIMAKEGKYQQTGSDVIALKGDINILAQDITIQEARESTRLFQTMDQSRLGITTGVSSPIISIIQQIERLVDNSEKTDNDRSRALAVGAAGLSIYNNYGSLKESVGLGTEKMAGAKGALASLKFSVSVGSSKSQSQSMEYSQTASSSNVSAAGNVNLVATGKDAAGSTPEVPLKTGGNITIQGSNVTAGNDATLIANDKINILAASNTKGEGYKEKSSSASVGVGVSIGQQTGFGIDLAGSGARGHRIEADQSWTYSHVKAGNTTTLISGGDTNIIGGQVIGSRVQADIGGDLNIESLQNTSKGEAKDKSVGASISIGWGTYTSFGAGGNQSDANSDGEYISVVEYAGIMAGSGGFQVNVKGNTDLKGAIIASTQAAIDQGKNELTTGSLTTSDLINMNKSSSDGSSMGLSVTYNNGDNGKEKGFGASPPLPLSGKEDKEEYSLTLSGISGGKITITDEAEQIKRTGQTAAEAIEAINTDVLTGMATGGLIKDWDVQKQLDEMKANIDITKEFVQETDQFVAGKVAERQKEKEKAIKEKAITTDPERIKELDKIIYEQGIWDNGGAGRVAVTAIVGALSGNVAGSSADILQSAAVNVIQSLGATQIKYLVDTEFNKNDDVRAILQGILACAGASAQNADCGSAALGAGAAVVINHLLDAYSSGTLSEQEKLDRVNLVNSIITGIVGATGGDAHIAKVAAQIEMENNRMHSPLEQQIINKYVGLKFEDGYELTHENLMNASCYLIKCSQQFKEGSADHSFYSGKEEKGASLEKELTLLGGYTLTYVKEMYEHDSMSMVEREITQKLFTHTGWDSVTESLIKADGEYQIVIRSEGALKIAGSAATGAVVAGSCALSAGTACVLGGTLLGGLAVDFGISGAAQVITGARQNTFTSQAVQQITGYPAEKADEILSFLLFAGELKMGASALAHVAKIHSLDAGQVKALEAIVPNIKEPSITTIKEPPITTIKEPSITTGKGGTSNLPHLTKEQQQLIKNAENISTAKPGSQVVYPRDLNEQIVWRQVLENPSQGKKLIEMNNDPRFPVSAGFQKMEAKHRLPDGKTIEIHYQYNSITDKAYDMKITTPQRVQQNPQDVIESIKDKVK